MPRLALKSRELLHLRELEAVDGATLQSYPEFRHKVGAGPAALAQPTGRKSQASQVSLQQCCTKIARLALPFLMASLGQAASTDP